MWDKNHTSVFSWNSSFGIQNDFTVNVQIQLTVGFMFTECKFMNNNYENEVRLPQ